MIRVCRYQRWLIHPLFHDHIEAEEFVSDEHQAEQVDAAPQEAEQDETENLADVFFQVELAAEQQISVCEKEEGSAAAQNAPDVIPQIMPENLASLQKIRAVVRRMIGEDHHDRDRLQQINIVQPFFSACFLLCRRHRTAPQFS